MSDKLFCWSLTKLQIFILFRISGISLWENNNVNKSDKRTSKVGCAYLRWSPVIWSKPGALVKDNFFMGEYLHYQEDCFTREHLICNYFTNEHLLCDYFTRQHQLHVYLMRFRWYLSWLWFYYYSTNVKLGKTKYKFFFKHDLLYNW